jgi:hypothetical protein
VNAEFNTSAASDRKVREIARIERVRRAGSIGSDKVGNTTSKTGCREITELLTTTSAVMTGATPVVSRLKFMNRTNIGLLPNRIPPECSTSPRASALSSTPSITGETIAPLRVIDSSTLETEIFRDERVVVNGWVNRIVVAPPPIEAVGAATAVDALYKPITLVTSAETIKDLIHTLHAK